MPKLLKPEKYLFAYTKHLQKCKLKNNEDKKNEFNEFVGRFTSDSLSEMLIKSFVANENQSFTYFQAKLFGIYIVEHFNLCNFFSFYFFCFINN